MFTGGVLASVGSMLRFSFNHSAQTYIKKDAVLKNIISSVSRIGPGWVGVVVCGRLR